jgi:hypothetical protein
VVPLLAVWSRSILRACSHWGSFYGIFHCHDVTSMVQWLRPSKSVFTQHLGCIVLSLLCAIMLTMCHTANINIHVCCFATFFFHCVGMYMDRVRIVCVSRTVINVAFFHACFLRLLLCFEWNLQCRRGPVLSFGSDATATSFLLCTHLIFSPVLPLLHMGPPTPYTFHIGAPFCRPSVLALCCIAICLL